MLSFVDVSGTPSVSTARPPSVLEGRCRAMVMRVLGGLRHGTLRLVDGQGSLMCGSDERGLAPPGPTVTVHDPGLWTAMAFGGTVGVGESYGDGHWTCDDLPGLIALFSRNRDLMDDVDSGWSRLTAPARRAFHWLHTNTRRGARRNIAAHYDLGNAFFARWLDPTMSYSSGIFPRADSTLDEAALHKLDVVCQRLDLRPGQHLVEIGTGWGGLAMHAARHYGVRVTTTTISQAQYELARERVAAAGLADRITVLDADYRDLPELIGAQADRLVSIEMVEAIGHRQYPTYLKTIDRLLVPGGTALIQAITIPEHRYLPALRSVDFIQRHIFPGCNIPSVGALAAACRDTRLDLTTLYDFGQDYARTLACWRERFNACRDELSGTGYDQRFCNLWEFYLAYCEGGFRANAISVAHLLFTKHQWG